MEVPKQKQVQGKKEAGCDLRLIVEILQTKESNFDCQCVAEGHLYVVDAMNILDKSVNKQLTKKRGLAKIEDTKYRRSQLAHLSRVMRTGQWRSAYDWAAVCGFYYMT